MIHKKNIAFTLAEVLITLGIIGVIAALTLPSLINNYRNKALKTGLKRSYSLMEQALSSMQARTGITPTPEEYGRQKFKEEYIKEFKILLDCGLGSTDVNDRVNASKYCVNEQLTDKGQRFTDHYKTFDKKNQLDNTLINNGQFVLADGTNIFIENWDDHCLYISVDVNGLSHAPNVWGYDLFTFQLTKDGRLAPMGKPGTDYAPERFCSKTSSHHFNGVACTYWALTDEKYWKEKVN